MRDAAFADAQRGVAIRMAVAVMLTAIVIGAALAIGTPSGLSHRLAIAATVDLSLAAWLGAGIANVARLRFFSPDDIAGGGHTTASAPVRDASAILQNTLEQVVLAIPAHLAVAIAVPRSASLLIALGLLFAIGRMLFWHGYARGAAARALGFALTFYSTMATLVLAIGVTVLRLTM